ncbi:MAG: putative nicotinamide N-methyase [Halioglobus sp.]
MTPATPRQQYRYHGAILPTSSHPAIRRVRRQDIQPSIHGNKLWKSSCLLIDYLEKNPPEHCSSALDVACGWGIAGIWCAKSLGMEVTSVDADRDVFPYLDAVAVLNQVTTTPLVAKLERLSVEQLSQFDMLIAADICFWDELAKPVANLVGRAVKAGVKKIIIADPERAPFFTMAQQCMERHCAELLEWEIDHSGIRAQGAIMVIENA